MRHLQGVKGVPKVYWYGQEGGFSILIMQKLGPNIEQMYRDEHREFSLMTLCLVIDRMIDRLRDIHD